MTNILYLGYGDKSLGDFLPTSVYEMYSLSPLQPTIFILQLLDYLFSSGNGENFLFYLNVITVVLNFWCLFVFVQ